MIDKVPTNQEDQWHVKVKKLKNSSTFLMEYFRKIHNSIL